MSFTNKVVIVTGAASGIGAATARALAREGAKLALVLVDKDEVKLKEVAKQYEQHKGLLIISADLTKDEDVKAVLTKTIDHFGELHVLVNCAGIVSNTVLLDEGIMNSYDLVMNTNLRSIVYLMHLAAPHLIKSKGNVVNISSISAFRVVSPKHLSYSIAKAGLNHFTRCAALELASNGVRVNAISPGCVNTGIVNHSRTPNQEELLKAWIKECTALNRITEPEEIADLVVFLASDKARSITGSIYLADNGALLK